jgi:hypothetical protein
MKRLLKSTSVGILLVLTLLTSTTVAAVVLVDTFTDGDQSLMVQSSIPTDSSFVTGSSMLTGERDSQLTYVSGSRSFLDVNFDSSGTLAYSQNATGATSRALVQWDGSDSSMNLQLDSTTVDLVDSTNDSLVFQIISNDNPMAITVTVYSSASNWSYYQFNTPGGINAGDVVDIVVPFLSFQQGGTGSANFASVDALELAIDGTLNQEADLTLDFFEANSERDFGDLPSGYPVTLVENGARHVVDGLRFADNVDTEADGTHSASNNANTDDNSSTPDDEDGVTRDMGDMWQNNQSVDLIAVINGCSGTCYINGWIDWGNDGFAAGDQVLTNQAVTNGSSNLAITVPGSGTYTVGNAVYSRFRLCSATGGASSCTSWTGETTGGEVEDYWWNFGTNAVTLNDTTTQPNHVWPVVAAGFILLGTGTTFFFVLRKRRKAQI